MIWAAVATHVPLHESIWLYLEGNGHLSLVAFEVTAASNDELREVRELKLEAVGADVFDAAGDVLLVPVRAVFPEF